MTTFPPGMILPDDKIAHLEQIVASQGKYLTEFRDSVKKLNRRNTLAVMELQTLVMRIKDRHPDVQDLIDELEPKLKDILDFKKDYVV